MSAPQPVNVRALRRRLRMTQNTFSARFGFSVAALRHWERGERRPSGAALTLLNVIAHQPRAVLVALRAPIPENLREKPRRRGPVAANLREKPRRGIAATTLPFGQPVKTPFLEK
ncbi:MAG: helix-turn-helix domain-containing protein [Pseudomonadota bacterium]|nr:helix-turn-helix domain-containing protein [Pseudomonadota bacterium]